MVFHRRYDQQGRPALGGPPGRGPVLATSAGAQQMSTIDGSAGSRCASHTMRRETAQA